MMSLRLLIVQPTNILIIVLILASTLSAFAVPESGIPQIISAGCEAYKAGGPEAAITAWLKGSPLEGSKEALSQAAFLTQVSTYYGKYASPRLLAQFDISPLTQLVYVELDYEKGPAFAKFTLFKIADKWVVLNFRFHTEAEQVLPSNVIYREK